MQVEHYEDFDAYVANIRDADLDCIPGAVREWRIGHFSLGGPQWQSAQGQTALRLAVASDRGDFDLCEFRGFPPAGGCITFCG